MGQANDKMNVLENGLYWSIIVRSWEEELHCK
jgi:hypothetical protein